MHQVSQGRAQACLHTDEAKSASALAQCFGTQSEFATQPAPLKRTVWEWGV